MSNILSQQIPIRMMGLGPAVSKYAQNLRRIEMECSRRYRICTTTTMTGGKFYRLRFYPDLSVLTNGPSTIDRSVYPVVILAAALFWTRFENGFTAQLAFPTLSLIAIVQMPLFYLIDTWASIPRLWACMKRIQKYLQLPEWSDKRQHYNGKILPSAEQHRMDSNQRDNIHGLAEQKATNSWQTPLEATGCNIVDEAVIELKDARISPAGHPQAILQGINLRILRSKIIVLIGPISCGKSILLQTLIGEGTILRGAVIVAKSKWAFCDQSPYLINVTIKEDIIGPNTYDEKLYHAIVEACQLLDDFCQLAAGDETVVGSDGMNLSVGQRHRVALARAAYTRAEIMVVEDIFGSQDQITARAMIQRLFGPDGLLRRLKTTIVFASHLAIAVDVADELLQIEQKLIHHYRDIDDGATKARLVALVGLMKQVSERPQATANVSANRLREQARSLCRVRVWSGSCGRIDTSQRRGRSISILLWLFCKAAIFLVDCFHACGRVLPSFPQYVCHWPFCRTALSFWAARTFKKITKTAMFGYG